MDYKAWLIPFLFLTIQAQATPTFAYPVEPKESKALLVLGAAIMVLIVIAGVVINTRLRKD